MKQELWDLHQSIKKRAPLIHCLTNHISINDCANAVLEVGGRPIMAEHPLEVEGITASAKSLVVNMGNISDNRMKAIELSGRLAYEKGIPKIIDMVGLGCSPLRYEFAKEWIERCQPEIIKGNHSEIKALLGLAHDADGIDVGESDQLEEKNIQMGLDNAKRLSKRYGCVVLISGAIDIVVEEEKLYSIHNGHPIMAKVTGTGCMLNAVVGTYLASNKPLESAVLGALVMGIAGEVAKNQSVGTGSFRVNLHDQLYNMTEQVFLEMGRLGDGYEKFQSRTLLSHE